MCSIESVSSDTGWTFHYEIPEREIGRQVTEVVRPLWFVTTGMVLLSFIGVWFLAQELYKPGHQLIQDKENAERLMEENKPFLREDALHRLLDPSDTPEEEWRSRLARYGTALRPEGYHTVTIAAFEQYEGHIRKVGESAFEQMLLYKLEWLKDWAAAVPDLGMELVRERRLAKFVLILSVDAPSAAKAERRTEELVRQAFAGLREGSPVPITMGVGHAYRQLTHLCASYEEAVAAYQYRAIAGDDRIIHAKFLPDLPDQGFLFHNKLVRGAFNAVRQCRAEALEEQLGTYYASAGAVRRRQGHFPGPARGERPAAPDRDAGDAGTVLPAHHLPAAGLPVPAAQPAPGPGQPGGAGLFGRALCGREHHAGPAGR